MATELLPLGIMGIQGRNGSDTTFLIPDNQCLELWNVDLYRTSLGKKRGGSKNLSLATSGTAFATGTAALGTFIPGADRSLSELWALDFSYNVHRLAGGTTWATPATTIGWSLNDQAWETNFVPYNGKLFITGRKTGYNFMSVYDPLTSTIRNVGIDPRGTPTLGGLAAGLVTDTRKYRVAYTRMNGSVVLYRSNLSDTSASQVLAAQLVTVTRPAAPGMGETHWELYAASTTSGFADYRLLGSTAIANTTYIDNTAALPTTVAPDEGANTPPPSAKYAVADDARMILAGAFETPVVGEPSATPSARRVWWTPALGAGVGDDERIVITGTVNNYADVDEAITGLSRPFQVVQSISSSFERGSFYVFSFNSQWKFIATTDPNAPYLKFKVTGGSGCLHHKSIVLAIDANGSPALYWWSPTGPFRITSEGQEYIGEDLRDVLDRVNLGAKIPCHSIYHRDKHQIWFYVALDGSDYPNYKFVYDTLLGKMTNSGVRGGWMIHDGEAAKAYCSTLFSETVGAAMSIRQKPYVGYTGANKIWKCDTTDLDDDGTPYQAYIDTKSYAPWGLGRLGGIKGKVMVVADPQPGTLVHLTVYRNEADPSESDADLTDRSDNGTARKVFAVFDDAKLATSLSLRCRIGDATALSNTWSLDGLVVPVTAEGDY